MSGYICGKVVFDNQALGNFDESFDKSVINQYKLDQFDYSSVDNAQFACGLIHVTEEDKSEKLPFHDVEAGLYITADVILDNREELIQELSLSGTDKVITDGFIVLEAYKKWGYDTPKHLLGDFAFAIWDANKRELFLTKDHTGTRSLYYSKDENSIRFSTTINPLISRGTDKQELLNEEWMTMYFALPNFVVDYDTHLTMYKNVFQCPIASSLIITNHEIKTLKFWEPLTLINQKNTKFNKNEWIILFNTIFNEAVKCRTHSTGNIGISLSSGLDSTSVAAIASKNLESKHKNLHSFTSIPLHEVKGFNEKHYKINEKKDVELFIRHYPNILPNYLDCVNKDIVSSADELIKIIEMPFKALDNLTWINETYIQANMLGCKILLTGQFGNFTISRGDFLTHIQTLKKHRRYSEILREVEAASKLHFVPKRFVLKKIFIMNVPKAVKRIRRKILRKSKLLYNPYLEFINEELLNKYQIIRKLESKKIYEHSTKKTDFYNESASILNEMILSLVGTYDTKFGLHYGLIIRDPTKDIRVIEYCLRAPYELFVENGIERKLIRDAMENIVPDEIRMEHKKRGVQGVDWDKRISYNRIDVFRQFEQMKANQVLLYYLKCEKVEELIRYGNRLFEPQHIKDLRQAICWIIISKTLA